MVIGICDDENVIRDKIEKICINETKKYCEDVVIQKYSDGREVLEKDFDILILDIEMEDVDGIVVKNYFQKRKKDTIIIFVTSHNEMMSQAFGVNVMGFVAKSYLDNQLQVMLDGAMKRVMNTVSIEGVDSRKVCYIQAEHIYNILHLENETEVSVRCSSADLEKMLEGVGFIRVHRTYIINMAYVDHIKDKTVLVNKREIPVSARLKSRLRKEYSRYCRENARYC
ncbi:LytR/AlgR family response regulator transcription factor [Eubacterium ventriosum]|uniref:LytR/AlgR family response regulator transcription factor n=1 Tax=Eubacterium ventriosum TaxID=39496 RepID=UPI000E49EA29|nr:LytTR family DNA-binding domain-containing protein [Eubacterium ventriosum]MBD9056484.1 DNA-binding response regulator [Eubacterium ventriosum]RHD18432.1 DNA-binding response regulator [Eubacterium ventriosum]